MPRRTENELAVRDRVRRTLRAAHVLSAAVTHRQKREQLRLDDSLPESVHLLRAGDGEQVDVAGSHLVDRPRKEIRRVRRVGVGKAEQRAARHARAARARPLLAEPAGRQVGRGNHC